MNLISKIFLFVIAALGIYLGILYFGQSAFIFYPDTNYESPQAVNLEVFKEQTITADDGTEIMTWFAEGEKSKPAILFFHGNAWQISGFASQVALLARQGYPVLMAEYRGFGNTKGKTLQKDIYADAAAVYDWLKEQGYDKIVAYGYSFGTAVTMGLAHQRPLDGIILTAPFSSLKSLVAEKPVPLAQYVLSDEYPSVDFVAQIKCPLLIIHGKSDRLIPYHHAEKLYAAAPVADKQLVLIDKAGHHDIFFRSLNMPYISAWLRDNFSDTK